VNMVHVMPILECPAGASDGGYAVSDFRSINALLFLDGVYVYRDDRPPRFQRVKAPDKDELEDLLPRAWFS